MIWVVVGGALLAATYVAFGGRALWRSSEHPDRLVGQRVQLMGIESGPRGLARDHPALPPAIVERFDGGIYVLRFEQPMPWLGKTETYVTVASRSKGYPVSLAASRLRRTVWVSGKFGSGEAFLAVLRRV